MVLEYRKDPQHLSEDREDGRRWKVDIVCITSAGQVNVEPNNNPLQKQNLRISNCLLPWKDHQDKADGLWSSKAKLITIISKKGEKHLDSLNKSSEVGDQIKIFIGLWVSSQQLNSDLIKFLFDKLAVCSDETIICLNKLIFGNFLKLFII